MTGIAGILGRSESVVTSRLDTALSAMRSRGSITEKLVVKGQGGYVAIGSCSHSYEESQSVHPERNSLVVDGPLPGSLEIEEIGGQVDEESLSETIAGPTAFSGVGIIEGRLLAARDALGQKPLYLGNAPNGIVAFASLKAALSSINVQNPDSVPPGKLMATNEGKATVLVDRSLREPQEIRVSEHEASDKLKDLLLSSLADEVPKDSALAFSGGLDSSLIAQAAKENGLKPELVTVGMKGQPELKHAREIAKRLDLDVTVRELSQSDVLESLSRVVATIESTDPTLVGVSIPLFFACEVAEEMEMNCLLAGQLSDELFGGYGRFDDLARRKDSRSAREEVWRSVKAASANDFEPGDKLAVSHHLSLRCPFAFLPLVEYALSIPISLKLRIAGTVVIRKHILRRVAADWKLPRVVVDRPKKAVQYSSGVQKILLKEAKRRRMTMENLLESVL